MKSGAGSPAAAGSVHPNVHAPRVEAMRPQIEQTAHELIDLFEADGEVELIGAYCMALPLTISAGCWVCPRPISRRSRT